MSEAQLVEFPLDDVEDRIRSLLAILPEIGVGLREYRSQISIRYSTSPDDDRLLMRKADRFVEKRLLGPIRAGFPRDFIHSEEEGDLGEDGEFHWWIDPVDGTRNLVHGLPLYCIVLGLCFRDDPVAGIVLVPELSETYHAIRGGGAYKNEQPVEVSTMPDLERGLIANGLPYERRKILNVLMADISAFATAGAGLRRTGSTALDLCWVADGRLDAMWERGVRPWDVCGPSVIIREAGGRLSDFSGSAFDMFDPEIVASNGVLHGSVIETLKKGREIEAMN